jgi:Flp pilus assembly protein TadD
MTIAKATLVVAGILLASIQGFTAEALYEKAAMAARNGDLTLMQRTYEEILHEEPRSVRAWNGKATAQAWRGNYYAAQETFRKALTIEPDNLESLVGLGYAHAWAGDYEDAGVAFDQALALDPDSRAAIEGDAYLQLWSGNYSQAEARFEDLSAIEGQNADVAVALGRARLQNGNPREAVSAFDHALAIDPGREDASAGRVAAFNSQPRGEASIWYGSTSNAESGLRLVELGWWLGDDTRLGARYDDSLSLDNPALARDGESAETISALALHRFTDKVAVNAEIGRRELPDGDQDLYRGEVVLGNLPGKLTLGAQLGAHELGYDDNLWYIGFGIPFAERWQVESNNYFATTGIDRDDEWRSVLNLIYNAPAGWEVMVGGGYGQVDSVNALSKEDVNVIHGLVSMPIFGFHRLQFVLRRESVPSGDFNIAMLGVTLRLPH